MAYAFDCEDAVKLVERLESAASERDDRNQDILAIRSGDYERFGDVLPEDFPKPLIANLIDTASRDMAESMSQMPTFTCGSVTTTNQAQRKRDEKRSQIVSGYFQVSNMDTELISGADRHNSFGFMYYVVEPMFGDIQSPVIRVGNIPTTYYTRDGLGRVKTLAEVYSASADVLAAKFEQYADVIKAQKKQELSVIHWYDEHCSALILRDESIPLVVVPNPIKRTPAYVVERPRITADTHGQFDDVIGVQIARAMIANYTLEAIDQAVNAPLQVPNDVQRMELGPLEAIQTDGTIQRVRMGVEPSLFPEQSVLSLEQMQGSRYPTGRSGSIDASIITGQGVDALNGVFQTQIQTFHRLNAIAQREIASMCFEMDEAIWPNAQKSIRLHDSGSSHEVTYTPSSDIAGDYTVDVSYGAVAGLDPNRALIFLLQGLAAKVLSKDTVMKHLPVDINPEAEQLKIDLEMMHESLAAAISTLPQMLPAMQAQGQDPREVIQQFTDLFDERSKGRTLEEAAKKVLIPKEQAAPAAPAAAPPGAPPGAAGPQDPASQLLSTLSGMTASGRPNLQANVVRQQPIQ